VTQAIKQEASARGYEVSLASTQFSEQELMVAVKRMIGMRVAALAIMTTEMNTQVLEVLRTSRTPAVFEDVGTVGETISNIRIDYEGGIFKAVKYLVDLGHKRILFVESQPDVAPRVNPLLSINLRTKAFQNVVNQFKAQGIKSEIVNFPGPGPKAGEQAIYKALDHSARFTAVIAIADPVALGVLHGLHKRGIQVPHQVSVVGFDNSYICEYLNPPLTSVDIPRAKLGKMLADCLVSNVEGKVAGRELVLETELVLRMSASPLMEG
jgi:LacI family transcriptional regulator